MCSRVRQIVLKYKLLDARRCEPVSKEEKAVNKNIKFNYFVGYLSMDKDIYRETEKKFNALKYIEEKLKEKKPLTENQKRIQADEKEIRLQKSIYDKCGRSKWSAQEMFEKILSEKIPTNIAVGDIPIEIEPGTLKVDADKKITTFQLSKLRSDLIPAKKKIEKQKEEIRLNNDEYIGEFTSVLYDEKISVFIIQSNFYGLTVSQVESYLTLLRRRVIEETKGSEISELACELQVIIDSCDIGNIKKSQEVKKIRFRAADGIYDALGQVGDGYLPNVRRSLGEKSGYIIDITVSIDKDSEIKTIDDEIVSSITENFDTIKNSQYDPNLLVEVTRKEDENSATELINLLQPKMYDNISIKMKPRVSVAHEFLCIALKEKYEERQGHLYNIVNND